MLANKFTIFKYAQDGYVILTVTHEMAKFIYIVQRVTGSSLRMPTRKQLTQKNISTEGPRTLVSL